MLKETKHVQLVPLGLLGKDSHFPYAGFFTAQINLEIGNCTVIGRIHDADIKRDFRGTIGRGRQLQKVLESCLHISTLKSLFREIWEWFHQNKSHSQIASLLIELSTPSGEVWLSASGLSGLWVASDEAWYPLLSGDHAILQNKLVSDYPLCLKISPIPKRIVGIPQPFQNQLPDAIGMNHRVFEVSDVN